MRELHKVYRHRPTLYGRRQEISALAGVSFTLDRGETVAIVGRSGSGKSTLARCLAGHLSPTSGQMILNSRDLCGQGRPERSVQLVFQDSPAALNPRWTGFQLIAEPLRQRRDPTGCDRVFQIASNVGLPRPCLNRVPGEMSGGQRQKLAIARALAVEPLHVLILDEPFRGLDESSKNQLRDLLIRLQEAMGWSMLYISHNLSAVRRMAQSVLVLDAGEVAESGPTADVLSAPQHSSTRALVEAILPEPPWDF